MTSLRNYRDLSPEEQRALWEKCKAGDKNGRRELIELNEPLARAVASRFARDPCRVEDLVQGGMVGLLCALERFDPQRGVPFGVYAFPFIKGEVLKCLREMRGEKKTDRRDILKDGRPIKEALAHTSVSLEEWLEAGEHLAFADETAEDRFRAVEDRMALQTALSSLSEGERRLLYYRYYLRKSQAETGKELSLSQTRISRKEREILGKLRGSM